jgi:hypothetical protein
MNKDEALRLALDELCRVYHDDEAGPYTLEVIKTIKQALEQPEPEPVECMCGICKLGKREWQGLTDEEMHECWGDPLTPLGMKHARMIEAKLKEKNHD